MTLRLISIQTFGRAIISLAVDLDQVNGNWLRLRPAMVCYCIYTK